METVLLIESNPANLVALALILRCLGYSVLEAGSQGEAWFVSRQCKRPIQLLLTEAIPGDHSTSEFIARLRLVYPRMRGLFICDESPAVWADMPCEYALLQKPYRVETLSYAIRGLLQDPYKGAASSLS